MYEYFPILVVAGFILLISVLFIIAYAMMKNKNEAIGFDRNMKDGDIVKRLLVFAKPHIGSFLIVLFIMALTIAYDIVSPIIVGPVQGSSGSCKVLAGSLCSRSGLPPPHLEKLGGLFRSYRGAEG